MSTFARNASRVAQQVRSIHTKVKDPLSQQLASHAKDANTAPSQPFGFARWAQANLFRRNAVYIAAIMFGCAFGAQAYDGAFNAAWEYNNKGKLFKDMIKNYPGLPPNTEPEGGAEEAAEEEEAEEAAEDAE